MTDRDQEWDDMEHRKGMLPQWNNRLNTGHVSIIITILTMCSGILWFAWSTAADYTRSQALTSQSIDKMMVELKVEARERAALRDEIKAALEIETNKRISAEAVIRQEFFSANAMIARDIKDISGSLGELKESVKSIRDASTPSRR